MLRFLYSFVWKGGFLDGAAGYVFCRLLAIYEYLSVAKYHELKRAEADQLAARQLSAVPAIDFNSRIAASGNGQDREAPGNGESIVEAEAHSSST